MHKNLKFLKKLKIVGNFNYRTVDFESNIFRIHRCYVLATTFNMFNMTEFCKFVFWTISAVVYNIAYQFFQTFTLRFDL